MNSSNNLRLGFTADTDTVLVDEPLVQTHHVTPQQTWIFTDAAVRISKLATWSSVVMFKAKYIILQGSLLQIIYAVQLTQSINLIFFSSFQTFTVFWISCAFFWVIPRRVKFMCRRFGTHCLFHLWRPMKMGQSVPKRRHINFWRWGITQKKAHENILLCVLFYFFNITHLKRWHCWYY